MCGYADFVNEVSGCGGTRLRDAKGRSSGKSVVLMGSSGGGSPSLSCSSSLESRTKEGWGSLASSMYGDERIRGMRVAGSSREDDVAETGRKVGVGGVVGRVGVGDVLGYVGEDRVVSDRVR